MSFLHENVLILINPDLDTLHVVISNINMAAS